MHTDRYLHFESSHHPTHVKRDAVRCLHDRAREIISKQERRGPLLVIPYVAGMSEDIRQVYTFTLMTTEASSQNVSPS